MNFVKEIMISFAYYAKRPQLYPELTRKLYKNIFQRNSATKGKDESLEWCKSIAVSEDEAIKKYFFKDEKINLTKLFPEEMSYAYKQEESCPVKMGGAGALNIIYAINDKLQSKNVLETGVAYGWSSLAVLLSISKRSGKLYSSDMPYATKNNDNFVGIVVPEKLKPFWKLFRFADKESLPKIFLEQNDFDFIHYDSDKSYYGRMWAYNILWPKLKEGGIFMSDDVADNSAFMDYCIKNNFKPIIINFDDKYAGFIFK